jgi:hypothetical protein
MVVVTGFGSVGGEPVAVVDGQGVEDVLPSVDASCEVLAVGAPGGAADGNTLMARKSELDEWIRKGGGVRP